MCECISEAAENLNRNQITRMALDRIEEQEDRKNKKSEIKEKKGYYRHYNQRSYPDDFWDSFYCN